MPEEFSGFERIPKRQGAGVPSSLGSRISILFGVFKSDDKDKPETCFLPGKHIVNSGDCAMCLVLLPGACILCFPGNETGVCDCVFLISLADFHGCLFGDSVSAGVAVVVFRLG